MKFIIPILLLLVSCAGSQLKNTQRTLAQINENFEAYKNCSANSQREYDLCHLKEKRSPYLLRHNNQNRKVALLIHGLSDGPFMHKDIAWALFQKGYNVLVPLMPGHGQADQNGAGKPEALHKVKWQNWTDYLEEKVWPLVEKMGTEHIIIGGLSNGGILAVHSVINMPNELKAKVKGILLFSPILALPKVTPLFGKELIKLVACNSEGFMSGKPYTGGGESFRYMFMSKNGVCQAQHLIDNTKVRQHYDTFHDIPIFGVMTEDDTAIDQQVFSKFMENTNSIKNTFIVFSNKNLKKIKESENLPCLELDAGDCQKIKIDNWKTILKKAKYIDHAALTLSHREENFQHIDINAAEKILNPYYKYIHNRLNDFIDRLED